MRRRLLAAAMGLAVAAACGSKAGPTGQDVADAGGEGQAPDGSAPGVDAGESSDVGDAGVPPDAETPLPPPTAEGWTFYDSSDGLPSHPVGVTADEGGNLWVAGGESGLFLLEPGASSFRKFDLADGLHPWGEPYEGQGPVTSHYLNVMSVSGGPAGTVFVGYQGIQYPSNAYGCEDNWDGPNPDPSIYKSGDADRVTLNPDGSLSVVHYDISSGPNKVADEPRGREKVCTVYRIKYDAAAQSVWFGGNHAYAWGDPKSNRVMEHAHPVLNGYPDETGRNEWAFTGEYYGLAIEPGGGVWVGGKYRSQHCPAGTRGIHFWDCEAAGSNPRSKAQLDWWPDLYPQDTRPSQRTDDRVRGLAVGLDGTLWIGSSTNGLARRAPDETVSFIDSATLVHPSVYSLAVDPSDGSVWVGGGQNGLTRLQGEQRGRYDSGVLPGRCLGSAVADIQVDTSGPTRRILVAFQSGCVGVYEGP